MKSNPNATLPVADETYIPPGSLLTVTIGRNRNDSAAQLNEQDWESFIHAIATVVRIAVDADDVFGPFLGIGVWGGIVEESAVLTFVTRYPLAPAYLNSLLAATGGAYHQDAVQWSFGQNRLAVRG